MLLLTLHPRREPIHRSRNGWRPRFYGRRHLKSSVTGTQAWNPVPNQYQCRASERIRTSMPCGRYLLKIVCLPFHHTRVFCYGSGGGIRTHTVYILSVVPPASWATPPYASTVAPEGFEPSRPKAVAFEATVSAIPPGSHRPSYRLVLVVYLIQPCLSSPR